MALSKSRIEYLTHVWNFYTGCCNQENGVCNLPCWARAMAHRFGRSFEPQWVHDTFVAKFPKEPARIGVCFTGDLFGDWVDPEMNVGVDAKTKEPLSMREVVMGRIMHHPQHQFLFLTKCPWNLKKWGRFPDNAWVGASAVDYDHFTTACGELGALKHQEIIKHAWLSIEPLINWTDQLGDHSFTGDWLRHGEIDWVVIGAQTQPYKPPEISKVRQIVAACDRAGIPVWLKDNLEKLIFDDGCDQPYFDYNKVGRVCHV